MSKKTPTDETLTDWSKPTPVTKVDLAFPAKGTELTPKREDVPKDYDRKDECERIVSSWFSKGLPPEVEFYMVEGIDGETAVNHLQVVLGTYGTRHQDKIAGAAWLLSLWTTDVKNWEHTNG